MNDDGRFFSPANLQTKEAGGVIDLVSKYSGDGGGGGE